MGGLDSLEEDPRREEDQGGPHEVGSLGNGLRNTNHDSCHGLFLISIRLHNNNDNDDDDNGHSDDNSDDNNGDGDDNNDGRIWRARQRRRQRKQ